MANIQGQKKWSDVRLLETHELARGGINGNLNEQAKALADRTEFLNQEKASKSEIIQGVFEFGTYAEFDAAKATLPMNCTVVINEENNTGTGAWGIGNNRWNGTTLIASYDPTQKVVTQAVSEANQYTRQKTEKLENVSNTSAAFEVADEEGNIAFRVGHDGKTDFTPADEIDFKSINATDQSLGAAFEVADEEGNIAFRVGHDGKTDLVPSDQLVKTILDQSEPEYVEPKNYLDGQDWRNMAVAYWDFKEENTPYTAKHGRETFPLNNGSGSNVQSVIDPVMGRVARFNGSKDYLIIPAENVGKLNLSKLGDECTVIAVAKRSSLSSDFIAGMWQENDLDPRRQYGLFIDLPYYGGDDQVVGHISYSGGPTPGYPYSRDYSASARKIGTGKWRCFGLTYDGEKIISYLDGVTDSRPSYTDNMNKTYRKNPYDFDEGLCRRSVSDFTVGAVRLTAGMGNLFAGDLAAVVIFDKALSPADMLKVYLDLLQPEQPAFIFDYFKTVDGSDFVNVLGWKAYHSATALDHSGNKTHIKLMRTNGVCYLEKSSTEVGMCVFEFEKHAAFRFSQLQRMTFNLNSALAEDQTRICVCIDGDWYSSNQTFSMTTDGATGESWNTAEAQEFNFTRDVGSWLAIDFEVDTTLSLGDANTTKLPNGVVGGIGFLVESQVGVVRISDAKVFN